MNNMTNHTTFALRFSIIMLMALVWAMPLLADFNLPTRFGTNNPNKIDNPNVEAERKNNFDYKAYHSTIYDPFGNQTPSSGGGGNPANNDGNGSGEDVGIPDWGDTPSEPLPLTDGTLFLLLIAATMITIIAIKQRKQKQLQSITTNNNNNPTQHMTTRKQTYQSFFQKLFLLLVLCGFATNTFAWKPIMIGHRGSRMGVENTEAAFINGVTYYGFQGLETDVKITKDGHYVCWHDDVIPDENISNKAFGVDIKTNTLAGLQGCDLTQTRNGVTYTGKICTVDRYLEICKQLSVIPVIELKENATICNTNMTGFPGLYALIQKHGLVDRAIILTSMQESLKHIRTNYPQLKCQYLIYYATEDKDADAVTYGYHYSCRKDADNSLTKARVQALQNKGIEVAVWSINDNDTYTKYCDMGVNMITSDYLVAPNLPDITTTPNPNPVTTSTSTVIYFRPGTTNFSAGRDINNNKDYEQVFWIKNGYIAMAINNPTTENSIYIGEGRKNDAITSTNVSNRFFSMTVPEGYTQIAAYRLNKSSIGNNYASWDKESYISNRIPVIGATSNFIDIPTDGKNLLVHYEGYWNKWYWAYYLPKNNDVCMYFANTGDWTNVKMLTGKDIYTFPTAEFTPISGTKLQYLSLAGNEYGYTNYGFINSSSDKLSEGWDSGLIPPVNWSTSDNNTFAFTGNRYTQGDANVTATSTNKTTFNIKVDKLSDNLIADRIKDAPNYTGLRDDLLKGINLFTPTSSTNGSEVAKTPITSWQDLNHKQYVTTYGGGSVTIASHKLNGATSTTPTNSTISTGTTNIDAAYTATVTLTATPKDGYSFVGWYEGQNLVSKELTYTYTAETARNITAYFAEGTGTTTLQVRAMKWNGSTLVKSVDGGTFTLTHSGGVVYKYQEQASDYDKVLVSHSSPVTFQATINNGYEFIGWFNVTGDRRFLVNSWIMEDPSDVGYTDGTNKTYVDRFTAVFAHKDYAKKQNINIAGPGTVKANYTYYTTSTREVTFEQSSSFVAWTGTNVTLTATPLAGYKLDGWYDAEDKPITEGVDGNKLIYTADDAKTITAKFVSEVNKLTVSVLNYNPEYDKFEEYGYEYNKITLKQGSNVLKESYSSFSHEFNDATSVTLTATPEPDEETGYDFIGWYQNGEQISTATEISVNVIGMQAISAHFAPKKCWRVILDANAWGKYTLQYSKDSKFSTFKSIESSYTQPIYTFVPYKAYVKVSSVQPIHGYTCLRYKRGGSPAAIGTPIQCSANNHNIQVELVRDEEQVVYLNLKGNGGNIPSSWSTSTPDQYAYYAFVDNEFYSTDIKRKWIRMEHVNDYCYRCTISPANRFNKVNFVQVYIDSNGKPTTKDGTPVNIVLDNNETYSLVDIRDTYKVQKVRSGAQTIPSTRNNCYRLSCFWNSTTGKNENAWTEPPTQVGDFRLVYIEQTVVDKNTIREDYHFDDAGLIKQAANSEDIISLHIYNKVSDGVNGVNNPEIILQKCTAIVDSKSQWEDVERRMIFGPLRATDEGVIRMPGRRNAGATINYDNGIDAIKNDDQDNGSGVWNFVISQDGNGNATILAERTLRYTGDYYIRTTNADGQYNNYTHPGNIMTYSAYAAANSDYTDYFIRYVDINEDGTATAEPGKHPVIKFAIANDYAVYLNHELMINNDRFKDDEYEDDMFVLDKGGAPNLPADASVRFGWDRVTNRLTRAYIANTTIKNNEYLVVDGTNIGNPSGDNKYFTDNSNWLYTIDLNATKNATANVKAKMNGQYQYFMGSESKNETLISGNGASTYPIRLLYDFKDDRFTTIYRPNAALSGTVNLETPVMIEREHNNAPTQIQFNQGAKITVNGDFDKPAYAVMTFLEEKLASKDITHHEKMFYWVSFPFAVKISDVFGLGKYGQYWIMQRYDGAQRAASGLAQNNWKYITNTGYTLEKNIGYVICLNYNQMLQDQLFKSYGGNASQLNNGKLSLYFPSKDVISPADISLQPKPVVVSLEEWEAGENIAWNHLNWHLIGVPSFATPGLTRNQTETPFLYEYYHPTDGYAAIANVGPNTFLPMHSYMVQYAGDITWNSVVNTTPQSLAARRDAAAEDKPVMLHLELQQAGNTIDKTFVQLRSDKGTLGFDLNLDLSKIINAGSNIYSVVSGDQMAGNAIPKEETVLPIGVVTSAAGEYTFAMPQGTEGMLVELIDYEQGTSMNLLMSDYTVTLPKGTFDQRFALRLKPDKVATSVDNIGDGNTSGETVRKLLIDGMLYLQKGNMLYDAQGHAL